MGVLRQGLGQGLGIVGAAIALALVSAGAGAATTLWWWVPVPNDAVVAFDREKGCPDGWRPHAESAGLFIVGVQNSPREGDPAIPFRRGAGSYKQPSESQKLAALADVANTDDVHVLQPGEMDNMPPYIALWFCTPGD